MSAFIVVNAPHYMDHRLKILHSAKVECGFRTTPEECLYVSGLIGLQYRAYNTIQYISCRVQLWRDDAIYYIIYYEY